MKYNIELAIKKYIPSLIELLGDNRISWTSANKKFEKHLDKLKLQVQNNGNGIIVDANFYTLLKNKIVKIIESDAMFDFYISRFENLNSSLNASEKRLISQTILNFLTEMSRDYLNFIGELSVLDFYKNAMNFDLIGIEEKVNSNSSVTIDFLFNVADGQGKLYLEVLNLHIEKQDFKSKERLKYWLESKFNKKKESKYLKDADKVLIQPVIWTKDLKQLEMLEQIYDNGEIFNDKVNIPLGYASFYIKNNHQYEHRFEPVNMILKEE
jgi:hypothetical protein